MAEYFIRPKYWSRQIVMLLSDLKPGDVINIAAPVYSNVATTMLLATWGVDGVEVRDPYPDRTARCLRCGSDVFGDFCTSCDHGTLHAQTCGQLWNGVPPGSNVDYLVDHGLTAAPGTPCNCGGDQLEHSIRHAENDMRL